MSRRKTRQRGDILRQVRHPAENLLHRPRKVGDRPLCHSLSKAPDEPQEEYTEAQAAQLLANAQIMRRIADEARKLAEEVRRMQVQVLRVLEERKPGNLPDPSCSADQGGFGGRPCPEPEDGQWGSD